MTAATITVPVPGGTLVADDSGGPGPAIIAFPGIGDLRHEYRFVGPLLVGAGFRFVAVDLRGHGESSSDFESYTPEDVGRDAIAVMDHLGLAKATLMGTSFAAAGCIWAEANHPDRVDRLVLLGPFTRDMPADRWMRPLLWLFFNRLWGVAMWVGYFKKLFKDAPPADLDERVAQVRANMKEPGRLEALRAMMKATKRGASDCIPKVACETLILMGSKDPDFKDPQAEAQGLSDALGGPSTVHMVPGAGHYPQVEQPKLVAEAIIVAANGDLRPADAA